jgi:dTDP-4-amino-4,6-dideoxygalactose transaminase
MTVPAGAAHPAHLYFLLLSDVDERDALLRHLSDREVQAVFHYQPLHTAPAGRRYGRPGPGGCPVTENVADRLVRLPLWAGMSDADTEQVIAAVRAFGPALVEV